ncbi:titin [Phlebotomus argentipes]|uniref:titin n=1 Tax=Phlebotomus argentipes TaxID=94469 RepID=UPI002893597E|nr:titin [Phlebotomus argentipes]XP_059620985.1 titin [Phlebotomus argentipes]XP_059620986.1 titin [Phlebotomus argentipes]XP_059620987.1 titin [Phlebotomus argentipes]
MMNGGVKNGLSTLNRLLGKKNKDDSAPQSKHASTFSRSVSQLDMSSQHNKIVPLAAMSNAPFEQTFRITVCLPRDQLYVARVGAKTRLAQLMELTCVNKQLDRDKYEFRHPMDNSQVFSNDLTIGEVGLNEIRMVPKTERLHNGNNFNLEDLSKMRPPGNRESLSSSEVSRHSRQFLKTTSPYSSTNSLNSVESSGSRTHPPVAPVRKKRAAPRPPSQNSIPEGQEGRVDVNRNSTKTLEVFKKPLSLPVKKNFHVSSPNLTLEEAHQLVTSAEVHRNGSPVAERYNSVTDLRSHDAPIVEANNTRIRPMSMHIMNGTHQLNGKESPTDANHSRTSSESSEMRDSLPEPVPRKRQIAAKKKKTAPAPPPRTVPPIPTPRSIPKSESSADEEAKSQESATVPNGNVSKVMLNVEAPVEHTLVLEEHKECLGVKVVEVQPNGPLSIAINSTVMQQQEKQEEPKVSITEIRRESANSSDEDDVRVNIYNIKTGKVIEAVNEAVNEAPPPPAEVRSPSPLWTYTLPAPPKFADGNSSAPDDVTGTLNGNVFYDYMSVDDTRTVQSDSNTTLVSDVDIRPVIREVIADPYAINDVDTEDGYRVDRESLLQSLEKRRERYIENEFAFLTKMDEEEEQQPMVRKQQSIEEGKSDVIGELNSVISSNKIESVIRKAEVVEEIETAKPSNLSNFRISTYSNGTDEEKPAPLPHVNGVKKDEEEEEFNEEDFLRRASIEEKPREFVKRQSLTNRRISPVARSDSFHSTRQDFSVPSSFASTPRSSSYISLLAAQKFESRSPRRHSSELSITDSPSLQSIEVMKSILSSSRKNLSEPEIVQNGRPEIATVVMEEKPEELRVEVVVVPKAPEQAVLTVRQEKEKEQEQQEEDCPKKWVYKGPPKINLSAWSERPKVQVCIKSDRDYCFGGSTTLPRGFRTDPPASLPVVETKEPEVPNLHVPIVRGVEYKKNVQPPEKPDKPEVRQKPVNRVNSITSASLNARPLSLGNFSKIAPVVRGFRAEEEPPVPLKSISTISLNRTASVTKISAPTTPPAASAEKPAVAVFERRSVAVNGQKPAEPIFSQHTLRRTGLKEKILAQEEAPPPKIPPAKSFHTRQQAFNHSISLPPPATPAAPVTPAAPAPPPPPPQLRPVVRAVVKKQMSAPEIDPRDQLLNSIRNFNKGSLRKM